MREASSEFFALSWVSLYRRRTFSSVESQTPPALTRSTSAVRCRFPMAGVRAGRRSICVGCFVLSLPSSEAIFEIAGAASSFYSSAEERQNLASRAGRRDLPHHRPARRGPGADQGAGHGDQLSYPTRAIKWNPDRPIGFYPGLRTPELRFMEG